jgi:hypothetical protein
VFSSDHRLMHKFLYTKLCLIVLRSISALVGAIVREYHLSPLNFPTIQLTVNTCPSTFRRTMVFHTVIVHRREIHAPSAYWVSKLRKAKSHIKTYDEQLLFLASLVTCIYSQPLMYFILILYIPCIMFIKN